MKTVSLNLKQHLVEGSHVLATLAWTLIFAAALSSILSGQTASGSRSWNPNRTTSTATSAIPLPKDLFTVSLIFAVALTAALFSSWVIPECALAITDEVLTLGSRSREEVKPQPVPPIGALVDRDTTTQDKSQDRNEQIDEKTKMVKLLMNMMHHLENRLLREAILTEQETLNKYIQVLEARHAQLGAELEKATHLPQQTLNDMLQVEEMFYIPDIDGAIAEQIAKLQLQRHPSPNGNGSLKDVQAMRKG